MKFAVVGIEHGHIYGMIKGLLSIPGTSCEGYHTGEASLHERMRRAFPNVPAVKEWEEILGRADIPLVCLASVPSERAHLAARLLRAGKHVFVDPPIATTLEGLGALEEAIQESGQLLFVNFHERIADPAASEAIAMVRRGEIGQMVHFLGIEPHKLSIETRPSWMFCPEIYGGILNDLAVHQFEMFAQLNPDNTIEIQNSRLSRLMSAPESGSIHELGDVTFKAADGTLGYIRVDWLTPDAMPTFGDIRHLIVGTEGTLEVRKKIDPAIDNHRFTGHQLIHATRDRAPYRVQLGGSASSISGLPAPFYELIWEDVLKGENRATPLKTTLAAARAALEAQCRASSL